MELFDIKFDGDQGDAQIDIDSGVFKIIISDKNPNFPSGAQISIPFDAIFEKFEAQAPNLLVKWGEKAAQAMIDGIE